MDTMSELLSPGAASGNAQLFLWAAVLVLVGLMASLGTVAELILSRRRDTGARLMRVFLYMAFPGLIVVPVMMLADQYDNGLLGLALFFYVVLYVLFCYYLGRRIGRVQGRKSISDLVGLDSPNEIEDAQDRLFESRMRYPLRADVVKSIGEMAKAREAERRDEDRVAAGRPPGAEDVDVVEVESGREDKSGVTS